MSYLVFARKWRPKNFDEVVGQDHITKALKNALRVNKLAQAYLFAGPQGVGKTSCARILAKALNCAKGPGDQPCGACSPCLEIAEGRSLDVIEIDGASNRGIDEIRTLRENVKFSPLNGRVKVYIIDEVHMLTQEAFNALLKTLEEPPPFVKFVFATTQPEKVLPTILSRCQRFDFVRLPSLKIVAKLREIAQAEGVVLADDVLFAMAKASEGSLRDAESILDQMISFSSKDVTLKDVISVLGIIEGQVFFQFVAHVGLHDPAAALEIIADVCAKGKDLNYFLEGLLEYYRNLMVLKVAKSDPQPLVDLPPDEIKRVAQQAASLTLGDIMTAMNQIFAAQDMTKKLGSARIPLEVLAVKLCQAGQKKPDLRAPEASARPAAPPVAARTGFSVLKEEKGSIDPSFTPAEKTVSCTVQDVKDKWPVLINQISQVKMSLATYLKEALPVGLQDDLLTIGFPKSAVFFKEALGHKDNMKILEAAINTVCGHALRLKLDVVEGLAGRPSDPPVEETPFLKSALDLFQGKVIKS